MGVSTILWTLLTITACSSDDDDDRKGNGGASDIVGNWFLYHEVEPEFYSFKKNGNFVKEVHNIDYDEWWEDSGKYWTKDGKLYFKDDEDGETLYSGYIVKGDILTLTLIDIGGSSDGAKYRYERTDCKSLEECLKEYYD